jgi:hypothetical protein
MFNQSVNVSLECPAHPEFMPDETSPTKKCRCCQSITNVYEWLRMAKRSADKIHSGLYSSSTIPDTPELSVETVADVLPDLAEVSEKFDEGTGQKRAIATKIKSAPEIFGNQPVRRKL